MIEVPYGQRGPYTSSFEGPTDKNSRLLGGLARPWPSFAKAIKIKGADFPKLIRISKEARFGISIKLIG